MRLAVGILAATVTTMAALSACNLELQPYVAPEDDDGDDPSSRSDSGGGGGGGGSRPADGNAPVDGSGTQNDASTSSGSGPTDGGDAGLVGKRIFVTSKTINGNLGAQTGADSQCQTLANGAGLGGKFIAWLSTGSGFGPASPAIGRIQDVGPWFLVDRRTRVFANKAALTSGTAEAPINRDEKGVQVAVGSVWTGTQTNGTAAAQTCSNFQSTFSSGLVGRSDLANSNWTAAGLLDCDLPARLYCIEQ
jgi:hypothetical protein